MKRSSPNLSRAGFGATSNRDKDKAEQELQQSVRKATNTDETAPKQKHVRVAAVFSHDFKQGVSFWNAIKLSPVLSDEISSFKALITIHKVMRDGHPSVLQETLKEGQYLDAILRNALGQRGYSQLIQGYVAFLRSKLEFHSMHPEFTADMDYEDYKAMRKVSDVNEGYLTITELFGLQDQLDKFQRMVFANFRQGSNNECRIAALVPLVEESYGIYKFLTSMLAAMHESVEALEALTPLREKYKQQYEMLRKFYFECSNLRYLTSLITVPTLPAISPDFTDRIQKVVVAQAPREKTPPPDDLWGSVASISQNQGQLDFESHQSMMLQQQLIQHGAAGSQDELNNLRNQNQQLINGYEGRLAQMQYQLREYEQRLAEYDNRMKTQSNWDLQKEMRDQEKDALIRQLQEEVALWKNKYESMAKMYAQLRKEHLEVLQKFKEVQSQQGSAQALTAEKEKMAATLKAKFGEMEALKQERDKLKSELDRAQETGIEQIALLRKENADAKFKIEELSHTKGEDSKKLIAKFQTEKDDTDQKLNDLLKEKNMTKDELQNMKLEFDRIKAAQAAKDEELAILQAGLDQSLLALAAQQKRSQLAEHENEASLSNKMNQMKLEHRSQMDKIMDSVLEDCKHKCQDASLEADGERTTNQQAPELLLSLIEKTAAQANEFTSSFTKHLVGGEDLQVGKQQADAIKCATILSTTLLSLASTSRGLLVTEDDQVEKLTQMVKTMADSGKSFFNALQSGNLAPIDFVNRPQRVQQCNSEFLTTLQPLAMLVEKLAPVANKNAADDLGDLVEGELNAAAKAIQDAAEMLARLLSAPKDPKLTQTDVAVHDSILSSAKAITDAIGRLIICATRTQQEIVAAGKDSSGSAQQFYKKNSRWMEGLISAAKAVATATKLLVESADGLVHGTHSAEQLVVAANEVAAATAQLVAASRVKAARGSKTLDKLEQAAKAVTDATKLLVKAAEQARLKNSADQSESVNVDYSKLSAHEFKKKEMEQQVQILKLQKTLEDARLRLGTMRRAAYHVEGDYVTPQ